MLEFELPSEIVLDLLQRGLRRLDLAISGRKFCRRNRHLRIDFGDTLPAPWLALTRELSCGRNEKINAGYAARPWEPVTGAGGAAWRMSRDTARV